MNLKMWRLSAFILAFAFASALIMEQAQAGEVELRFYPEAPLWLHPLENACRAPLMQPHLMPWRKAARHSRHKSGARRVKVGKFAPIRPRIESALQDALAH